jgi:hypothetical protein
MLAAQAKYSPLRASDGAAGADRQTDRLLTFAELAARLQGFKKLTVGIVWGLMLSSLPGLLQARGSRRQHVPSLAATYLLWVLAGHVSTCPYRAGRQEMGWHASKCCSEECSIYLLAVRTFAADATGFDCAAVHDLRDLWLSSLAGIRPCQYDAVLPILTQYCLPRHPLMRSRSKTWSRRNL